LATSATNAPANARRILAMMIPRNRLIAGTVIVPRHVPGSIAVINTALVICTFPPGVSRWLKLDLVHRAERKFHVPVIHVVTEAAVQARR